MLYRESECHSENSYFWSLILYFVYVFKVWALASSGDIPRQTTASQLYLTQQTHWLLFNSTWWLQ